MPSYRFCFRPIATPASGPAQAADGALRVRTARKVSQAEHEQR